MLKAMEISANGLRRDIKVLSQHSETALEAINALRDDIKDWEGPHHILDMERRELPPPLAGRDYLAELCKDDPFVELGEIFSGEFVRHGNALLFFPNNNKDPKLALEHIPVIYAIQVSSGHSGIRNFEIAYESEQSELGWKLRASSAFFDLEFEEHRYYLDWRGYFGKNSGLIDGFTRFVKTKRGWLASITCRGTGFIIAKVLRATGNLEEKVIVHVGQKLARSLRKAGLEHRKDFEDRDLNVLNVNDSTNTEDRCAVVLVHGTLSSAGGAFQHLDTGILTPDLISLYVYEHDTFVSVTRNAIDLTELITNRLKCSRLLFLAHSRGGLVARLAGHYLKATPYFKNKKIQVFSYGTPHLGTPLVNAAGTLLRTLTFAGGSIFKRMIPVPTSPIAIAGYFLTQMSRLPIGLEDMRPGSTLIEHMRYDNVFASAITCYAGQFDISTTKSPKLSFLNGFSAGCDEGLNDGVVSVASAYGAGGIKKPTIPDCSHFDYFTKPIMASDLATWVKKYRDDKERKHQKEEQQRKDNLDAIEKVFKGGFKRPKPN